MSAAKKRTVREPKGVASDVLSKVQRVWGESLFYQARLKGPAPDRLCHQPIDPRTPDKLLGRQLMQGKLSIGVDVIDCEGELEQVWDFAEETIAMHAFLHEFAWLRHIVALGEAKNPAIRAMAREWFDRYGKWSPEAWAPYTTGERLFELCCHGSNLMSGGDAMWRSRVLTSMARQSRHLARAGHRAGDAYERLMTSMALCVAGLCLPGCEVAAERGMELLRRELRLQIRPDGGHVSRNPSRQISIVLRLQMVLKALEARKIEAPGFLRHTLGRAAAHAQLFRAGDGRLAVFNGGYEDDGRALVAALEAVDIDSAPTGFARHTGFQRLDAARAAVIADIGPRGARERRKSSAPRREFESAGSFHFSSGRSRIIVNCGNGAHLPGEWSGALRQAAAHSSLSTEPASAASGLLTNGPVTHRRAEDGRGQLLEIDRTLGDEGAGARYFRRLFLVSGGGDLRGEDRFVAAPQAIAQNWRIRFHLHPGVKASLARDGQSVIMALPNKEGWRFKTNCRNVALEKSVYCGGGALPAATEQIVLSAGDLETAESGDMVVKWRLLRLDGV